jgi:hypothetical protein
MAIAGTALRIGPIVGMNSRSPAMTPSANGAFTRRMRSTTVLTMPMVSIAMSCVMSHLRSTVAIALSTSPARVRMR